MFLTEAEAKVLTELGERRWRTSTEIAEVIELHTQVVKSALRELAGKRLVERGGWGDSLRWGEYRITDRGLEELAGRDQLELPIA